VILGYEFYQMYKEGLRKYFEAGWNYIDLIGSLFMILYFILDHVDLFKNAPVSKPGKISYPRSF